MPLTTEQRFRRWTLGLYACAVSFLIAGMGWYLRETWCDQLHRTREQLHALVQLTHQTVQLQFGQYARSLRLLATQLTERDGQDLDAQGQRLHQFAQSDPGLSVLNVVNADGQILASTSKDAPARALSLNANPALRDLLERARAHPEILQLLHPVMNPLIGRLVIYFAMARVMPDAQTFYLVGGIDMEREIQLYHALLTPQQRVDGEVIGVLGQDGYLFGAWPLPGKLSDPRSVLTNFLQQPRDGALRQYLMKHPTATQGDIDGFINVGLPRARYLGSFQRLDSFPLYAAVFAPKRLVWASWQKTVLAPLIGAAIGLLILSVITIFSLRLLRRWFEDTQHKNKLLSLAYAAEARQNAASGLLGQSLAMAIRATDPPSIFQGLCALAHKHLECALVWVGRVEPTGFRKVTVLAAAGDTRYLDGVTIALDDPETGNGPFAHCIKTGKTAQVSIEAPAFRPWKERAEAHGIREVLAIPLLLGSSAPNHAVVFYGKTPTFFLDGRVVSTLKQMVREVALAVQSLISQRALEQARQAESAANARFHQILNHLPAGVIVFDAQGLVQYCSGAFIALYGLTLAPSFLLGRSWREIWNHMAPLHADAEDTTKRIKALMHQSTPEQHEIKLEDGRTFLGHYVPLHDEGAPRGAIWSLQDITSLKAQEAQIKQLINRDPLTGLANRRAFDARLAQHLYSSPKNPQLVVGIFDIDHFKSINDRLGHPVGDALLIEISRRMLSVLRDSDLLARLGGDEFGLILSDCQSHDDLGEIATRLLTMMEAPVELHGHLEQISLSMGFAIHSGEQVDAATLLRQADMAMYAAKTRGRRQYQIYGKAMETAVARHESLVRWVSSALHEGRLELYYQPILSIKHDSQGRLRASINKVEALLRLRDELGALHSAGVFEDVLDEPQLAVLIGRYALQRAVRQAAAWLDSGIRLQISVNISPRHFLDHSFVKDVEDALKEVPVAVAEFMELELTEHGSQLNGMRAREVVRACRSLGVCVSLDDFGTGSASLTHLQLLDVSTVKVDRRFTRDLFGNVADLSITYGMLRTAQMMGLCVIAEGVETPRQAFALFVMGCLHLQGHVISRPMGAAHLSSWMSGWRDTLPWVATLEEMLQVDDKAIQAIVSHGVSTRRFIERPDDRFDHEFYLQTDAQELCTLGRWCAAQAERFGEGPALRMLRNNHSAYHDLIRDYIGAEPGTFDFVALETASRNVRKAFWDVVLGSEDVGAEQRKHDPNGSRTMGGDSSARSALLGPLRSDPMWFPDNV